MQFTTFNLRIDGGKDRDDPVSLLVMVKQMLKYLPVFELVHPHLMAMADSLANTILQLTTKQNFIQSK